MVALFDLGYIGFPYTWNNRRASSANVQERLDRGFANPPWKLAFSDATITHLQALNSDHRPLLFQIRLAQPSLPKPFRFESMWITHPGTGAIINYAWHRSSSFPSRLKNTKVALKDWNKYSFGRVYDKIRVLKDLILSLQSKPQDSEVIVLEDRLQLELHEIFKREELLWRDKAKTRWIEEGDANTHFSTCQQQFIGGTILSNACLAHTTCGYVIGKPLARSLKTIFDSYLNRPNRPSLLDS